MNDELFYEKATEIDRAIKAGSESLSYASDLLSLLEDPPVRDYFFNHLRSPEWLLPLLAKGLFANPPPPEELPATGVVRYPSWSASRYIARMARRDPFVVFGIL